MKTMIILAGIYNIFLAIFHVLFWKIGLINWQKELPAMSRVNRGIIQIMNLCLIFLFMFMAFTCLFHNTGLLDSSLGITVLSGFSLFWIFRLIEQFVFFGSRSCLFIVIFTAGSLLHLIPLLSII